MTTNLISVSELETLLTTESLVLFDCRFSLADFELGKKQYAEGHLPDAFFMDMETDLSGPKDTHSGRHPLPDEAKFQRRLRDAGVSSGTTVVCYDENRFAGAARLWWLLRYYGFQNIRVLNGGLSAWREAGGRLTANMPKDREGDVQLKAGELPLLSMEQMRELELSSDTVVIDSREAFRFKGEDEPIDPVAGRIPGAVNRFWGEVADDRGQLKNVEFLRQQWAFLDNKKTIVAYCGSGVTAAVNLLSLHEIGYEGAALYNGSWSQWCSYSSNPVERDV